MEYRFYIDIFLITLFLVDFVALFGTLCLLKTPRKIKRALLLAGVSAVVETLLYLTLPSYLLYRSIMLLLVNPWIVVWLFYPEGKRYFLRGYLTITGLFLFIGGFQTFFLYWFNLKGGNLVWMTILAAIAVFLCIYQQKSASHRQHECEVELQIHKQSIFLKAYHDTGNFLRDPYTKRPVSIVDCSMMNLMSIPVENVRYIPFHSVGQSHGLMQVFTIDALIIRQGDKERCIENAVIGLSEKKLFLKQDFHMLLHSELL